MEKAAALGEIGKKIVPILEEFGIEGFVIGGYIQVHEGRIERFTAACMPKDNAAITDGLGHLVAFTGMWAANAAPRTSPPDEDGR